MLEGGSAEEDETGQPADDPKGFARFGNARLFASEKIDEGEEGEGAEQKAEDVEGVGPDMVHPEALGDEPESPDHGGEQEEQVGLELHRRQAASAEAGEDKGLWVAGFIGGLIRKRGCRARICLRAFTELAQGTEPRLGSYP